MGTAYTNSETQQENRSAFAEAIKAYQNLRPEEKASWKRRAEEVNFSGSGYNLFISARLLKQTG